MSVASKQLAPYLEPLTEPQRLYVASRLKGMSKVASAVAAGYAMAESNGNKVELSEAVREAIRVGREALAQEVMFDRRKAHDMLMDAHRNAETATEQILAVREMIKLHGVAAPEVKELRHQVSGSVKQEVQKLSDADLLRLARLKDTEVPRVLEAEFSIVRDERQASLPEPKEE